MDHSTPNLPSRDFDVTEVFYAKLGFEQGWRDDGWMILKRGELTLEFFPHPDLKPFESCFSCCLRLDDLTGFYSACLSVGVPEQCWGHPRVQPPQLEESGLTIAALIDPDGTLLRLIQN
nr:bleomycin resistance protein [uncultured Sphingomonas sp.]